MTILYLALEQHVNPNRNEWHNDETFLNLARHFADTNNAEVRQFGTGEQALAAVNDYSRIDRLVIFAHGAPDWLGWGGQRGGNIHSTMRSSGHVRVDRFAQALAPRLVSNVIIGLAACTCGMSPSDWRAADNLRRQLETNSRLTYQFHLVSQFSSTGVNSFAYKLRDELLQAGATGVEVRAHMWSGGAVDNPHIILFNGSVGSPGIIMARQLTGDPPSGNNAMWEWMRTWRNQWKGSRAQEWILGGPSPTISEAPRSESNSVTQTPGSVIPDQRVGPLENSEAVVSNTDGNSQGIIVPAGQLPSREELRNSLAYWGQRTANMLNSNIIGN